MCSIDIGVRVGIDIGVDELIKYVYGSHIQSKKDIVKFQVILVKPDMWIFLLLQ